MHSRLNCRSHRSAATVVFVAAISLAGGCSKAASLRITSPANGARVDSGRTLVVKVEGSSGAFRAVQLLGSAVHGINTLTAPPYQFAIPIPPDTDSRTYTLVAIGTTAAGEAVQSGTIKIDVERPDPPVQIRNETSRLSLRFVGDKLPLQVDGIYADGSRVNLDYSSLTIYSSDNPAVASVDGLGLVTAVAPGSANITITNAGTSVVVPVEVAHGRPPARAKQ